MTMVIGVKPLSWLTLGSNFESKTKRVCIADELMLHCPAHLCVKDPTNEQVKTIFYKYNNVFI